MSEPLRCGLVGVGNHGPFYQKFVVGTDEERPAAEIVAVADTNEAQLFKAGEEMGIAADFLYGDGGAEDFLGQVEAIIVATPAEVRTPVETALNAGKHVFCENPLSMSIAEAQTLTRLAERQGLVLVVNEQWLWLPGVQQLQHLVYRERCIGDVQAVRLLGKGRHAMKDELPRIVSHLLSVAINQYTGEVTHCVADAQHDGAYLMASLETKSDIPIAVELFPTGYSVGSCAIELTGTGGRARAIGGFLESVWTHTSLVDTESTIRGGFAGWVSRAPEFGLGIWNIRDGQESKALADPFMNPSFWLLERFVAACRGVGNGEYPARRYLPVSAALHSIVLSADEQRAIDAHRLRYVLDVDLT